MVERIFDPEFPLPPIEDAKYSEEEGSGSISEGETIVVDEIIPGAPLELQPPANITVVEQIQRHSQDGTLLTDLVIEIQEVPGAANYEARVTRV